jgi:ribosomal protein S18 acetylase RimI-like enzyme
MDITIRKAASTDIDQLTRLLDELFTIEADFDCDEEKQRAGLHLLINSGKDCVMIAADDNHIVGMVTVQTLISTAEGGTVGQLEDMIVRHDYRGKGIGQLLLIEIERWASDNGLSRLQLLADRDNHPALDFYRRSSWSETQLVGLRKSPKYP